MAAIFDPFGNAVHTALTFPVLGEDVLVTGAGPIGCMACAVARHAGARHVVVTDLTAERLELATPRGDARRRRPRASSSVQRELGMTEGFDIGFEMSGNPDALRGMIANMAHGGRIAVLGIPSEDGPARPQPRHLQHAHPQGDLRPRDVRDLVPDDRDALQSGLEIAPVITHRFSHQDFEEAFAVARSAQSGKVVLDWTDT